MRFELNEDLAERILFVVELCVRYIVFVLCVLLLNLFIEI